ncbi:2-polyprenyl-6-methoxyphenol hydroxylase-like FAD-dependent oxidoreductase [Murinocardiopsis flavida]|uniref:2-polyprenyl-6-methoxyphenol hydroxylase-like FAD-dependent oxidoreductase n=1 Tax=Murinocardiopsis flavida TaxID=645275 RepID=A0A2P8CSX4_9ACTN|nr:FAD-dependent oxidoreductase [Murinocardiopsis flavida]PSK88075.1 2-polyprenyl-6-methoxyphenol hydroxylase-like FAD-dependent oxidoreductase [Murinocardiopsis flavida]
MVDVLVVGGGIAGTAAALALRKAGADVAVHEAHPDSGDDIGAFLTLAGNGMTALAQFGADAEVARHGFALTAMRVSDAGGAELATSPLGHPGDPLSRYRCLRRAALCRALRTEARRQGIPVHQGRRLSTAVERADGVTAAFADGSTATADLLVGADGLGSAVRPLIDPATVPRRYAGQNVFYGYATRADPPHEPERIEMIRGSGSSFGYAVSPEGETSWFARLPGPELSAAAIGGAAPGHWRRHLLEALAADATPAAAIVAATDGPAMVTNAYDLPVGGVWHTRRMVVIGDAAHAASPATGQGASMALEDAVVLAKALRDADGTAAALAAYDRRRRDLVEGNTRRSAQLTRSPAGRPPPDRPSTTGDRPPDRHIAWDEPLPLG